MFAIRLVVPGEDLLQSYVAALRSGWSPDNTRPQVATEQLAAIERDPVAFLARFIDREARGGPITLPDGTQMARLPGIVLWMSDGDFCGSIGLRWMPGTTDLPPHVLGHIGYSVVPWKRSRGYATQALKLMLVQARKEGLSEVAITTDPGNAASRRVIEANGGRDAEPFVRAPAYGSTPAVRYRLATTVKETA